MKIIFVENKLSHFEINNEMKYSLLPLNEAFKYDSISATANSRGFTMLGAIASYYIWDSKIINEATDQCNNRNEVCILDNKSTTLLLVPKTKGNNSEGNLILDLIEACKTINSKALRFSHYTFVKENLPEKEIETILSAFLSSKCSLDTIFWDIDSRRIEEMNTIYFKKTGKNFNIIRENLPEKVLELK